MAAQPGLPTLLGDGAVAQPAIDPPMVIVAGLALPSFRDGPGLLDCQHADQAELVAERVLHDRPVDGRPFPSYECGRG